MTSQKHSELVKYAQNELSSKGRVLRLDKRVMPDLVFIAKNGEVCAVEIELSHDGISEIKKTRERYSDFDKVMILTLKKKNGYGIIPKSKRFLTKEIYDLILKMTEEHYSQSNIAKELEKRFKRKFPQSTISMIQNGHRKGLHFKNPAEFEPIWIE